VALAAHRRISSACGVGGAAKMALCWREWLAAWRRRHHRVTAKKHRAASAAAAKAWRKYSGGNGESSGKALAARWHGEKRRMA